jgi:hypothetical protein
MTLPSGSIMNEIDGLESYFSEQIGGAASITPPYFINSFLYISQLLYKFG